MNFLKSRLQRLTTRIPDLIEQLSEEDLEEAWKVLQSVYCDIYMLTGIQSAKRALSPGDTLTRDEAIGFLNFF